MPGNPFKELKTNLLAKLKGLNPNLTYHSVEHTLDVIEQSGRIASEEGVTNERDLLLLQVAALYHDSGFLETYSHHEIKSCDIFLIDAMDLEFTEKEKAIIQGLIMSTKIPQQPKTHMERIICDADLDYLGRSDFFKIGDSLRKEFIYYKIVPNDEEWEKLQLKFLENHKYHTGASQRQREPIKQQNYSKLITE